MASLASEPCMLHKAHAAEERTFLFSSLSKAVRASAAAFASGPIWAKTSAASFRTPAYLVLSNLAENGHRQLGIGARMDQG